MTNTRDDCGFPKQLRLLRSPEFQHVFAQKRSVADKTLVIFGATQSLGFPRLGMAVSRKVGNAVTRNYWKRVLREVFRQHRQSLPAGLDVVVLPRRGAACDFAAVRDSLPSLMRRLARRVHRKP